MLVLLLPICAQSVVEGLVVDSGAKAPIARATVQVIWLKAPEGKDLVHGLNDQGPSTQTDDAGRFRIEVSTPCEFTLKVSAAGFSPIEDTATGRWALKEKESKSNITLTLQAESTIEGRVFDPVLEKPVDGLTVQAHEYKAFKPGVGHFFSAKASKTAADGTYRIEGLAAGRYRISAGPSQQATIHKATEKQVPLQVYPLTYFPATADENGAAEVGLPPGSRVGGIDLRTSKRKAVRARGKIVRMDGKPLAGAVSFCHESEPQAMSVAYRNLGRLENFSAFELGPLNAGVFRLNAWVDGASRRDRAEGSVDITVADKDIEDVVLVLRAGVAVNGILLSEQAKPGREDPLWAACEKDVMIDILKPGPYRKLDEGPVPVDRENGRWTIEGLPFVPLNVDAKNLPAGFVVTGLSYNGVDMPVGSLQLNEGAVSHEVKITVARVTNSVQGKVTKNSKPVTEAVVVLIREPISDDWKSWHSRVKRTGTNGEYSIETLEPGWYRIGAMPLSTDVPTGLVRLANSDAPRIEIGKSTNVSRDLTIP